jgi:hypothetical protein
MAEQIYTADCWLTKAEAGSYGAARAAEAGPPSTENNEGFMNTTGHYFHRSLIALTRKREFCTERHMRGHGYRSGRGPKWVHPISG